MICILLEGSHGTGKTLLSSEAVKIKISQFKSEDKPVRVIVTQYRSRKSRFLLKNFEDNYFKNIDVSILTFGKLCEDLNIEYDIDYPKDLINKIVGSLSNSDHVTIFFCDELGKGSAN